MKGNYDIELLLVSYKMKMMNKLPVKYPMISYQALMADLFSVLEMRKEAEEWICNNFNQLVYIRDPNNTEFMGLGFFYEHQPSNYQNFYFDIPLLKTNKFDIGTFDLLNIDIIKFIISNIDRGYYLRLPINMGKIRNLNLNYMHMVFIYGYDMDREVFKVYNYHTGKKYDEYEYKFEDMKCAFWERMNTDIVYLDDIIAFKPIEKRKISIDLMQIKAGLNDYLNSIDSNNKYKYSSRWKDCKFFFGEQYILELIKDIENHIGELRAMYVLYDFIKLLVYKVDILFHHQLLQEVIYEELLSKLQICKKTAQINVNLMLMINSCQKDMRDHYSNKNINLIKNCLFLKREIHETINILINNI